MFPIHCGSHDVQTWVEGKKMCAQMIMKRKEAKNGMLIQNLYSTYTFSRTDSDPQCPRQSTHLVPHSESLDALEVFFVSSHGHGHLVESSVSGWRMDEHAARQFFLAVFMLIAGGANTQQE